MFDFKGVEAAKEGNYLKPGYYKARIADVKNGEFKDSKIPYVEVIFETQDKKQLSEKFVLKTKNASSTFNPLSRIQYLFEAWLGKLVTGQFKTVEELAAYLKENLATKKAGIKTIIVEGEVNKGKVYGRIGLTNFVTESTDIELGEFEEGSDEWKKYVKASTRTTEATGKSQGILNGSDDDDDDWGKDEVDEDDAPKTSAPVKEKEAPKAKEKATGKAVGSKKKEEPKEVVEAGPESEADADSDEWKW